MKKMRLDKEYNTLDNTGCLSCDPHVSRSQSNAILPFEEVRGWGVLIGTGLYNGEMILAM